MEPYLKETARRAGLDEGDLREELDRMDRLERLDKKLRFEKELAVYKEAGKGNPPPRLQEEITNAQIDLKAQQNLLEAKKKDAIAINARYDEDRKRYAAATGKPLTPSKKK